MAFSFFNVASLGLGLLSAVKKKKSEVTHTIRREDSATDSVDNYRQLQAQVERERDAVFNQQWLRSVQNLAANNPWAAYRMEMSGPSDDRRARSYASLERMIPDAPKPQTPERERTERGDEPEPITKREQDTKRSDGGDVVQYGSDPE